MGEHDTWWSYLGNIPGWNGFVGSLGQSLGREHGQPNAWTLGPIGPDSHFTVAHVLSALLVALFLMFGAVSYRGALARAGKDAVVPPKRFNLRNLFEMFAEAVLGIAEGVMGKAAAAKYLPFLGSIALFVFFCNFLALIPGFGPPTDTLKTNLALSALVFLATHVLGVKEHGLAYFKHFLGPIPLLAPLMLPIELISHIARPFSLALRLMGNMAADHKVVALFFGLIPLLVPVPFLILGTVVVVVQTLVFTLLSMVYISMAVAHEEHH
jgi:F-type H+-transporting ATPase subunit a